MKPKLLRIAGAIASCEGAVEECLRRSHRAQQTKIRVYALFYLNRFSMETFMKASFKCEHYVSFYMRKAVRYQKAKVKLYEMADQEGIMTPAIKEASRVLH
ncbi:MAG: hypothetical protein WB930_01690 [Syntrophobacteraceae bacterium]